METPTEHGQALPAGMQLEEFVIERVLGSGGFGITYLARDTSLGRQVVIKENLPSQFAWRETATGTVRPRHTTGGDIEDYEWSMKNFLREAETLASLDHPGIVRVLRKFEANGTAYFVMPFVEGVALDELAKQRERKPFSQDELRGLLEHVLGALGYLHERGIYHRDIKPGNILVIMEGIPVLIDFGSARQRFSERSMTVVESAGYTPFEQLQSRGNVGPWSDLYALGGTLCKAITGEAPPKANDRIRKDPHVPLARREELAARFSTAFLSVLDKALLVNEADRWQNARDWLVALSQNGVKDLEPQEISAAVVTVKTRDANSWSGGGIGPITDSQATSGNSRRQRSLQVAGVVGLLLIAIGLLMWLAGRQRKQDPAASNDLKTPMVSAHPGEGRLMVTSDPAGALLLGETGDLFGKTPTEIIGLKGGERWKGRLELPGYRSAAVEVEVHAGGTTLAPNVTLEAIPQKVVITSEPQRAEVFKDGKLLGMTPWESSLLKVGSQVNFVIRKEGYRDVELRGDLRPGEVLALQCRLEPLPQRVLVKSEPSGAEIMKAGKVVGTTPWVSEPLNVGNSVAFEVRKDGYEDASVEGVVEEGRSLDLKLVMKRRSDPMVDRPDKQDVKTTSAQTKDSPPPRQPTPEEIRQRARLNDRLLDAKGDLAKVESTIESERARWKVATQTINTLTNNKRTPVTEGSQAYYRCRDASEIIQDVEKGAAKLKAEKERFEKTIQTIEAQISQNQPE